MAWRRRVHTWAMLHSSSLHAYGLERCHGPVSMDEGIGTARQGFDESIVPAAGSQ